MAWDEKYEDKLSELLTSPEVTYLDDYIEVGTQYISEHTADDFHIQLAMKKVASFWGERRVMISRDQTNK